MTNRILIFFVVILAQALVANQDVWKGDEYAQNSASQQASADDFLQGMSLEGVNTVLDVGCGDGKITAAMAKAIPDGSVVGVDISPSMVEMAKKQFSPLKNLQFQIQDAAKLHFREQFDLITSFTVMQWVIEQAEALRCFERALKPGGKLWIQVPTGLPKTMEQALKQTVESESWKEDFAQFKAPWRFYQAEEYQDLLQEARFQIMRLSVVTKHEKFPSRAAFHGFLKQWFPYLRPLAADQKDRFLTELLDRYLDLLPPDEQGRVSFIVDRLEIEAVKSPSLKSY
jgi:trans-aconitate 2-methyltransferase